MHGKGIVGSDTRDNLADVSCILTDYVSAFLCRSLDGELIEHRTICSLIFFIAAEAVDDLAAVIRIRGFADIHERIVECRDQHISVALFSADICAAVLRQRGEIEVHLKAGDLLVVLDSPLNRKCFARLSRILVVAGAGRSCIILSLRNEIIDDIAVSFDISRRNTHRYRSKCSEH